MLSRTAAMQIRMDTNWVAAVTRCCWGALVLDSSAALHRLV